MLNQKKLNEERNEKRTFWVCMLIPFCCSVAPVRML